MSVMLCHVMSGMLYHVMFCRFMLGHVSHIMSCHVMLAVQLRWPYTVFARAFADVIQRAHNDFQNNKIERSFYLLHTLTISVLFFF